MAQPLKYTEEATGKDIQTEKWKIHINEAGSGHPILFLHGGGPGATGWSNFGPNIQYLADKYRCIAVDMPGYGGSDPVAPYENDWALAAKLLMDAMGIEKAAICGNSLGGAATLTFAVNWPDRMSHIITMGSAPVGSVMASWPGNGMTGGTEGLKALAELRRDPSPENFRKTLSVMVYDDSFVTDELCRQRSEAAHRHPENIGPNASSAGMRSPVDQNGPSVLARLTRLDKPGLIIHGRDDRAVMLESSLQIFTALKKSRLLVFNECGHWAQLEHADEFNKQVDLFLSNN